MRSLLFCLAGLILLLVCSAGIWAQSSSSSPAGGASSPSAPANAQTPDASSSPSSSSASPSSFPASKPAKAQAPDLSPPRSDRVNVGDLGTELGESSSRDTQIDDNEPENDARAHPRSAEAVAAEAGAAGSANSVGEFHPWDPHKAAKSVEVGDYYFKRKNYKAAEDRYREALVYKENDAEAIFHLAVCLQKMERSGEALAQYEGYLKILPYGPHAGEAQKAIEHLTASAKAEAAK
jgi:tetratricopeptide (TPR) repeat protein